jgi:hypothetical protein
LRIHHNFSSRGIKIDKTVRSGLTGSSTEKGNLRDYRRGRTRGSLVSGNSDRHTTIRGNSNSGEDRGSIVRDSVDSGSNRGSHNRRKNNESNIKFNDSPDQVQAHISNCRKVFIVSLVANMAQCPARERLEDELVEDNFSTTQQLELHLDSHSSTLTFTLDTLAQHCILINQLQYEFDFLKRQGEHMEVILEARPSKSSAQSQNEEIGSRAGPIRLDLNVALKPPPEEDRAPKEY